MRLTPAALALLALALAACSAAPDVAVKATAVSPRGCWLGPLGHPFFAQRNLGFCPDPAVRT